MKKTKMKATDKCVAINFFTSKANDGFAMDAAVLLKDVASALHKHFPHVENTLYLRSTIPEQDGVFSTKHQDYKWSEVKDCLPEVLSDSALYYLLCDDDDPIIEYGQVFSLFILQHDIDDTLDNVPPITGLTLNLRNDIFERCFSDDVITLCERIAAMISATGGYIEHTSTFYKNGYGVTPMQRLNDVEWNYHPTYMAELVPGYNWGVLLTEEHIRRLGGKEVVLRDAPCYKKHEWTIGSKDAIFLQLTEDIFDVTDAQRLELKRFLEPVMLPVDPLIAAVEETVYEKLRMDNVVFSPEEREEIDQLEKSYKPMELNKILVQRTIERQKQAGTYVPRKTKKEQREALWQELKTVISISLKKN